jgi:hypothetical protein
MRLEHIIEPPLLGDGESINSIHWEVNTKSDFTGDVIVDKVTDEKYSNEFEYNFINSPIIYLRATFNIQSVNGSSYTETTTILPMTQFSSSIKDTLDVYPLNFKVTNGNILDFRSDEVVIEIEEPKFYTKSSNLVAMNYQFLDIHGNVIMSRMNDRDNLNGIRLDIKDYLNFPIILIAIEPVFEPSLSTVPSMEYLIIKGDIKDFNINKNSLKIGPNDLEIDSFIYRIANIRCKVYDINTHSLIAHTEVNDDKFTINIPNTITGKSVTMIVEVTNSLGRTFRNKFVMPVHIQ